MPNMKDMLMWMRTQQNKPEFAAAKRWLDRNQTPLPKTVKDEPEVEAVDETPADNE
jgi:hypothetical protein